jgi:hypothetical protein
VGILGQPFVEPVNGWVQQSLDTTGKVWETGILQVILQGSSGISAGSQPAVARYAGRLSWRLINNYQQLRQLP